MQLAFHCAVAPKYCIVQSTSFVFKVVKKTVNLFFCCCSNSSVAAAVHCGIFFFLGLFHVFIDSSCCPEASHYCPGQCGCPHSCSVF